MRIGHHHFHVGFQRVVLLTNPAFRLLMRHVVVALEGGDHRVVDKTIVFIACRQRRSTAVGDDTCVVKLNCVLVAYADSARGLVVRDCLDRDLVL